VECLEDEADLLVPEARLLPRGEARDVAAVEEDAAGGRQVEKAEDVEER
jgi:hypothetical protein